MKKFLILQARPEDAAADAEFSAILAKSGLSEAQVERVRLEKEEPKLGMSEYAGTILGGGPGCVSDPPASKDPLEAKIEKRILERMPEVTRQDLPFMGCCLGIGVLGHHLGPYVAKDRYSEPVGVAHCEVTEAGTNDAILADVSAEFDAFVGHKEALQSLPEGCVQLVASSTCEFQMIRFGRNVYATQFHPEADSAEFELRIRMYKDRGYFPPEDADRLIEQCRAAKVDQPEKILKNFVRKFAHSP